MNWYKAITAGLIVTSFNCYIIHLAWKSGVTVSKNLWKDNKKENVLKMVTFYLVSIIGEFILAVSAYILP